MLEFCPRSLFLHTSEVLCCWARSRSSSRLSFSCSSSNKRYSAQMCFSSGVRPSLYRSPILLLPFCFLHPLLLLQAASFLPSTLFLFLLMSTSLSPSIFFLFTSSFLLQFSFLCFSAFLLLHPLLLLQSALFLQSILFLFHLSSNFLFLLQPSLPPP